MSTELATWEPANLGEAMRYAEMLAKSPLMPKHLFNQAASVFLIMSKGRELGVPPLVAIDGIDVIQGKVTLKPQLMLGLVRKRTDVCRYLTCTETTDKVATFETHRVGDPKPTSLSFTIEDAKKMQLVGKDNYNKQPAVMLRWRAASAICRLVYSDLLNGAYVFGEISGGHIEEEIPQAAATGIVKAETVVSRSASPPADVVAMATAIAPEHVTVEPDMVTMAQDAMDALTETEPDAEPEEEELRMPEAIKKHAGKALSALTTKDLQFWAKAFAEGAAKPEKSRWKDQNEKLAAGCLAELERRNATAT